ncbi:MAG: LuxR C-terminal-related transcriptional regulator [Azospirillaceae bacterium]|nr:LuxR C-terminal-related transcriptional regulator [Azospirillaceae bacterium]
MTSQRSTGNGFGGNFTTTRIIAPRTPVGVVDRPRLTGIADVLAQYRLALVHAPAGSGKTTLLSQWHEVLLQRGVATAWYSVGGDESDPSSVASHLMTVVLASTGEQFCGAPAFSHEDAVQHLQAVIADATAKAPLVLFIDDYHLITDASVVSGLLADRRSNLTLVLASRTRPALTLGRLRANGELVEVSVDELQFSVAETDDFFRAASGVPLSPAQSDLVQQQTEGWAAGLRLASLVLNRRGGHDLNFALAPGSHRALGDYFLEEVMAGLPPEIVGFVTETAILETLSPDLCAAVTGEVNAAAILDHLEMSQLFIVALPGQQNWYRYHHLFLEFLRSRLHAIAGERVTLLHHRAAEWFIRSGSPIDAVRHAFLARRPEWAAELIERYCVFDYLSYGRFDIYYRWMRDLPADVRAERPLLSFLLTWRYINSRRFLRAEQTLVEIENACAVPGGRAAAIVHDSGLTITGRVHLMRALIGAYGADFTLCRNHIEAISGAPLDDLAFGQVDLDSIHAYLAFNLGDLTLAQRLTWKAYHRYEEINCHWGMIHSRCISAMAFTAAGHLREARDVLCVALETGRRYFDEHSYMVALPSGLLGALAYEIGDFDAAERLLVRGVPAGPMADVLGLAERTITSTITLARLYDATGRADEADALLIRISRIAYEVEDLRLDFQMAVERADRAFRLRRHGDALLELERVRPQLDGIRARFPEDAWQIWWPYRILEARFLAFEGRGAEAAAGLQAVARAAQLKGCHAPAAIATALATAFRDRGDGAQGSAQFAEDCARATKLGLNRALLDLGVPCRDATAAPHRDRASVGHVHALTVRERVVLQCLQRGLANHEISRDLGININTVKSHIKNIYSKIDVRNRAQAALRADEILRNG